MSHSKDVSKCIKCSKTYSKIDFFCHIKMFFAKKTLLRVGKGTDEVPQVLGPTKIGGKPLFWMHQWAGGVWLTFGGSFKPFFVGTFWGILLVWNQWRLGSSYIVTGYQMFTGFITLLKSKKFIISYILAKLSILENLKEEKS